LPNPTDLLYHWRQGRWQTPDGRGRQDYRPPDLRMVCHHPEFVRHAAHYSPIPSDTLFSILRMQAFRYRRMRRDEHPDEYEAAFLASLFKALDRERRDRIEYEDWFEEQPVLTQNSIRERSRLTAAGVELEHLPPVYRTPSEGRVECKGQGSLALY
jgi:hypothetical protein